MTVRFRVRILGLAVRVQFRGKDGLDGIKRRSVSKRFWVGRYGGRKCNSTRLIVKDKIFNLKERMGWVVRKEGV